MASTKSGEDHKFEPGTTQKLRERNSKWINDDYVKFLRFAERTIERTGEGIVAMITAHGYIDNPTFRGMRYHLMQTFSQIYVLDLHGNSNKNEKTPEGDKDGNVFGIRQGVAIFIGVKRKSKRRDALADVFRADCFGTRREKFAYLDNSYFETIDWKEIRPSVPHYEWVVRNENTNDAYSASFSVADLFRIGGVGIVTSRDDFIISLDHNELTRRLNNFLQSTSAHEALTMFGLRENAKWKAVYALKHSFAASNIVPISYRLFDRRYIYYHDEFIERPRQEIMKHFLRGENIGLEICRQTVSPWAHVFITNCIVDDSYVSNKTRERGYVFPLYLYADDGSRVPNLNSEIVDKIDASVEGRSSPDNIFDYVYAVLHSPKYREQYEEFLKIDFPRIPYPKDKKQFEELVAFGKELRELHLLESQKVSRFITTYPLDGSNKVEKLRREGDKVYINPIQHFGNVPEDTWDFCIGGYQPAQKWLKDRAGRTLSNADIEHYQKIIVALAETSRVMNLDYWRA